MISVTINDSGVKAALERAGAAVSRPLMALLGKQAEVEIRKHFRGRNSKPNKHGWTKKNFWEREGARNTALTEVTDSSATVSIASAAIGFKITGGTIRPKRGAALAIPLTAEAYAAGSPREWDQPERLFRPKGRNFLATGDGKGGIKAMYALVKSVTQAADPDALPGMDTLGEKLAESTRRYMARKIEGNVA